MKSLSALGVAAEQSDLLDIAFAKVTRNPQALFTDFQWFLYRARNTVYFTSYSTQAIDKEALMSLVANMVTLAPQLTHGFEGARPGYPLPAHTLDAVTEIVAVDAFDDTPDAHLHPGLDVFETKHMPLFRVTAYVRKDGPDAEGRASMIAVRSSHALMEGCDSALLTRSQHSGHEGVATTAKASVPLRQRILFAMIAAISAPMHLATAHILSPKKRAMGFKTLKMERRRIRAIANRLGVSQRAVLFGTVMFLLKLDEAKAKRPKIRTTYTTLDSDRGNADDDFFRVRAIHADFDKAPDLETFIRGVDARLAEVESKDTTRMQYVLNAIFRTHRFLAKIVPFLYTERFFRFNGDFDVVLTLVPPHRVYGNLTHGMVEPIYCGSYHAGTNLCTFVPARKYVTLNFTMRQDHMPDIAAVQQAFDRLEAN